MLFVPPSRGAARCGGATVAPSVIRFSRLEKWRQILEPIEEFPPISMDSEGGSSGFLGTECPQGHRQNWGGGRPIRSDRIIGEGERSIDRSGF